MIAVAGGVYIHEYKKVEVVVNGEKKMVTQGVVNILKKKDIYTVKSNIVSNKPNIVVEFNGVESDIYKDGDGVIVWYKGNDRDYVYEISIDEWKKIKMEIE